MTASRIPGFDDREKGFERKFQHDQELAFKIRARRNKLFGLWAAEHLGLIGAAAETYAADLVATTLAHAGDPALLAAVTRDFAAKGVALAAPRVQSELERCAGAAKQQLGAAT